MNYNIEKITTLIGARRIGNADAQIGWLLTDSRSLCFPEETLFFALKTQRNDGHRYIQDLYRRGVRNFVVTTIPAASAAGLYPDANFLVVPSPLAALQRLAERHRDEFDIPIVGITGSNGKTMVKEWLYQLLSPQFSVTRSPKSFNSQIGVPLSVWLLNEQTEIGLFEAGISQMDEMEALHDIIQPTIGVLTSLGTAHQENFRSLEEKCMEKMRLFDGAKVLAYNSDDDIVSRCIRRSGFKGEKIGWSRENISAPLYISKVNGAKVSYIYKGTRACYEIPFYDEASLQCSFACAAIALYLGVTPDQLAERMPQLEPVAMRLEVKEGQHGCTLINDSYNSDINSLDIALDFMSRRANAATMTSGSAAGISTTLILSDIFQSGKTDADLYAEVNALCMKRGINKLIGIGTHIASQRSTFNVPHSTFFATTDAFLHSEQFRSLHDEVILIKGARPFGFDRITEQLEQKVHETILEVNLNALVDNLNFYRSFLKPETKLVCMVKADAYGAGAVEVAKTLQEHRVDYLAVAVADEGVTLRHNGITQNIMIMNPEMTAFKTMFDYDLEPEVYSFRLMDALIHAAEQQGITGWPVHIKLDTGMHRLGFDPEKDIDEVIRRLKGQNAIIPRSVFSHFVGSDSDDFDNFSTMQFQKFDVASQKLQAAFKHKILRHMDNSAAIQHFPERQLDMCRLGLGLYGYDPRAASAPLHPVSTLKTTILQLRSVPKDETVGYSRKGVLTRDSLIAAIPIGYADGLNRHLGRGACYCLVNGQKAPYVGNICMDVAMIDVTDIPNVNEGDTVEIFGEHLPASVLSDVLQTIPYEVLTSVSNRVKKVYFQD
ncbi:MAG: bifunctional UDP-N-acetylmuramoyl-tripeptide:D-alanyl-D-alanine ligase/alanine racemase [Prevotella sp.]|nr:bifunctional UDP-N-acetylmuramoyl-tripeptide:D-alanyl-D-alanine ligase/alanine racemase [Prevotella sp.]